MLAGFLLGSSGGIGFDSALLLRVPKPWGRGG